MNLLGNLRISRRLALSFGLLCVILIGIGLAGIRTETRFLIIGEPQLKQPAASRRV